MVKDLWASSRPRLEGVENNFGKSAIHHIHDLIIWSKQRAENVLQWGLESNCGLNFDWIEWNYLVGLLKTTKNCLFGITTNNNRVELSKDNPWLTHC